MNYNLTNVKDASLLRLPYQNMTVQGLCESLQYAVVILSDGGSIIYSNSKAKQIFKRMCGVEILSSTHFINLFFNNTDGFYCTVEKIINNKPIEEERSFICPDSSVIWLDIKISTIPDSGNILLSLNEINRYAAEKSDRLKTEFLAQMSHEIRTPVNSILCFTSLLEDELMNIIPDELKSCFESIDSGCRRLIRTIDMILNMSQFQSDSYEPNYQVIYLNSGFLEKIIKEFEPAAKEKGLTINFIRNIQHAAVMADPYTLEQIFHNLIDNAIKFTQRGEISVTVYSSINNIISVDVTDSGVGISHEYMPNLFTPFSQEEMGYTRKYEGNGLGLALVKKYLEINRASILVDSKKNMGSTFTVIFRN